MEKVILFIKAGFKIGNPGYVPTIVVDKHGKRTTVYRLSGDREYSRKIERGEIEKLYAYAKHHPLSPPQRMSIVLGDQLKALFEHGPALMKNGQIVVRGNALNRVHGTSSGYGAVKIIWRHGEKSPKAGTQRQVTKADILRLPHLLRDIDPEKTDLPGDKHWGWRILRHDGAVVIYGVREFTHTDGLNHVVTIHIDDSLLP